MTSSQLIASVVLLALIIGGVFVVRFAWAWMLSNQRLSLAIEPAETAAESLTVRRSSWLGRWLFRAGFRRANATPLFLVATFFSTLVGMLFAWIFYTTGVVATGEFVLKALPGAVGEVFLPMLWLSPVLSVGLLMGIPALLVRSRRRNRVMMVEQDLPLSLDLMATLAEAGLSFDAALDRVLETQRRNRPLAEEFRLFQLEILTGRGRLDALRRMKDNVDVAWFSIFVSALIHAEQVGASLATTLRTQADDLRSRRRERALALAMGVPVKLLFPLIICFLPGIMIASLGPIIFQIVETLNQFLSSSLGG